MSGGSPDGGREPGTAGNPLRDDSAELLSCSPERRFELLHDVPFFEALPDEALRDVDSRFKEVGFGAGEPIYGAGEPATHLHMVAAGKVKLSRYGPDGKEVVLELLGPGDLFGGLAALGDERYLDSAQAHTACCVLRVDADEFQDLLRRYPSTALAVLDFTGRRLREAHDTIRSLSVDPVERRLAATLLRLARRHGEGAGAEVVLQTPLPQQDLAAMSGTTVETVSRVLGRFRRRGLVRSGRQWIVIADAEALRDLAEGG